MKRQDTRDAMRKDSVNGGFPLVPTQAQLDTMNLATQALVDSRQADKALKANNTAPEFTLKGADGKVVNSREQLARGPLVATF